MPIRRPCASHVYLSSTLEVHTHQDIKRPPPSLVQTPAPSVGVVFIFSLDDVDWRLRASGAGRRSRPPARPRTRNAGDLDGDADESLDELEEEIEEEEGQTASASFRTREVVILGQAGKIVGYVLEKVLAPAQELAGLECTVHI
ncbi:hypothetical protein DFH08DRAFT_1084595 [Mycena albidolilacea]|uniref:Uncharacterized protein n=1 Tax=Mycena albidolilacea TaxID=1033008 RepID=A0AAD6ZKU6_9AGAR|nr:hypothetical protein DFH08DRAFT_1084595 [Mycena albidolilacea]